MAIALGIALVAGLVVRSLTPQTASIPIVRMPIPLAADENLSGTGGHAVAISPDGRQIVYSANGRLTLRPADQLEATPIAGAEGGELFFSPDGQWIGYRNDGQLKKIALSGGAPVTLAEVTRTVFGASWGADDTILFGQGPDGIWQVPDTGGTPEQLIAVEEREWAHGPQMLPGGEAVLYTLAPSARQWDEAQIVVEELATGDRTVLIEGGRDGRYLPTGHLVYLLNHVLFAVPFDSEARAVTGRAVSLVEGIRDAGATTGGAHFSVADTGALVYVPGTSGGAGRTELVWVDRAGQTQPVGADQQVYLSARVSPDGTRVALWVRADDNVDIWIYDLGRVTLTRLTFDVAFDAFPLWTPDGSRVVFQSLRDGGGLYWRAADGTGEVERLLENANDPRPSGWSADGRLVFEQAPGDVGVLTVEGDRTVELVLDTAFRERTPAISPDGRWIAYDSNESGRSEIYVRPFPNLDGGKWQVSADS